MNETILSKALHKATEKEEQGLEKVSTQAGRGYYNSRNTQQRQSHYLRE